MYAAPRLYLNFFQPSFKLKSKTRDGARVQKKYHAPTTPCDRLLALPEVAAESKAALREQFNALDPVLLLQTIRDGQQRLAELSGPPSDEPAGAPDKADVASFLHSLSTAWKDGEVRPTQRKQPGAARWW